MTKSELRKARKAARAEGRSLSGELRLIAREVECNDRGVGAFSFSESERGYRARDRWARWHDSLNGAPAGDCDV